MSLQNFFGSFDTTCEPCGGAYFNWTREGMGFGQLSFYMEDDKLMCGNELMSKELIKKILCEMVDKCELDCPRSIPELHDEK